MRTVHKVEDVDSYDLKGRAERVRKNKPERQVFQPVTAKELTDAFTRGCAVRTGCIASLLDMPRVDATEERASTSSKGGKRKRHLECRHADGNRGIWFRIHRRA